MRSLALAAALAALATPALPQEGEVTIVMSLELPEGGSQRAALQEMKPIRDRILEQPGLIEEQVLKGSVETSQDYVQVMRWESMADWEALFEDQVFLDLLSQADPRFRTGAAEVYTPVPPEALTLRAPA